eukprot:GHVS01004350.1.p2 GENE.GHVS01004350.1~~GHVS01004350.1.p2  ORF type:complete len:156 (-),score=14.42 GHVS01004350.1:75-542(-)
MIVLYYVTITQLQQQQQQHDSVGKLQDREGNCVKLCDGDIIPVTIVLQYLTVTLHDNAVPFHLLFVVSAVVVGLYGSFSCHCNSVYVGGVLAPYKLLWYVCLHLGIIMCARFPTHNNAVPLHLLFGLSVVVVGMCGIQKHAGVYIYMLCLYVYVL